MKINLKSKEKARFFNVLSTLSGNLLCGIGKGKIVMVWGKS